MPRLSRDAAAAKPSRRIIRGQPDGTSHIATEKMGRFTRAQGASSGWESWPIAFGLIVVAWLLSWLFGFWAGGAWGLFKFLSATFAFQLLMMQGTLDSQMLWYFCTSLKLGPACARNASIGFAECVRPGGSPTKDHCLNLYSLPPVLTAIMFSATSLTVLALGPFTSFVRVFYPEHEEGVNSGRYDGGRGGKRERRRALRLLPSPTLIPEYTRMSDPSPPRHYHLPIHIHRPMIIAIATGTFACTSSSSATRSPCRGRAPATATASLPSAPPRPSYTPSPAAASTQAPWIATIGWRVARGRRGSRAFVICSTIRYDIG